MSKQTDLINVTDAITVSGSNVGIGTSSPDLSGFGSGTNGLDISDATLAGLRLNGNAADSLYLVSGADRHWVLGRGAVPMTFSTNGTERMRIDAVGRVTMPYQPAFYWTKTSTQTSTTTNEVVVWDSGKVNTGNHFNNQRFTAPVAGVYLFQVFTLSLGDTATNDIHITKNGSEHSRSRNATGSQHETTGSSAIISLAVNDYVEATIGGSGQSVYGDSGDGWSGFGGYLIG